MALLSLDRGDVVIGVENYLAEEPTLGDIPFGTPADQLIPYLVSRLSDLETLVEGKVTKGEVKSEIRFGDEGVLIAGEEIALVGNVTFVDYVRDLNGQITGEIDESITRIRGGVIQTEAIIGPTWGTAAGMSIDLDNETITMGGSAAPDFFASDGNVTITGTLQAGSVIETGATVDGSTMGDIKDHTTTTGSNPHNTPLSTISGDLDDLADGSTYFRSTANQNTGGTRAYNALDSSFDYIRSLSTQNIVVSGTNPTNGLVIDSAGVRAYDGGALTLEISASTGSSTWSGDMETSGQVIATGTSTLAGAESASIIAVPDTGTTPAVFAESSGITTTITANALSNGGVALSGGHLATSGIGTGVSGSSASASGVGVRANNSAGGAALGLTTPIITGDANFEDDVEIDLTLTVHGASTFNSDVTIQGNSDLRVDRSTFVATDETSGDSSLVIGNATATGQNTIVINEGSAGGQRANEFHFYGALSTDATTTLGIVSEQAVTTGTSPSATHRVPVVWNTGEYWLYLEAR